MRTSARVSLLLVLVHGLAGCGGSGSSSAPSAVPEATPIQLVVFTDRASGFSTSDVRDAQDQIVRFNTGNELIWTVDGRRFPGYHATGNALNAFLIRFGTKGGERRAYLTWPDDEFHTRPVTVCDIEVVDGRVVITETDVPVPGA